MKLPGWTAPVGYILFCMATTIQLLSIFVLYMVLGASLVSGRWERADLSAPIGTLIITAIAWVGWILHRAPTARNRGLYIVFQACLFGVPLFCGALYFVAMIFFGGSVGVVCAAVAALSLLFIAGTTRYRQPRPPSPTKKTVTRKIL